jgi:hypothetical protein
MKRCAMGFNGIIHNMPNHIFDIVHEDRSMTLQGRGGGGGGQGRHTTDAGGGNNMQSVLERNDLEEFMYMVRGCCCSLLSTPQLLETAMLHGVARQVSHALQNTHAPPASRLARMVRHASHCASPSA